MGLLNSDVRRPSSEQTGYTFVPEPVSDAVKETLGTTNIVSGTFYRTEDGRERTEARNPS